MCKRLQAMQLRRALRSLWAPLLAISLLLGPLSAVVPQTLPAQQPQSQSTAQLLQTATKLLQRLQACEAELIASGSKISDLRERFDSLKSDYQAVQQQLTAAQLSQGNSAREIATLSASSDKLRLTLDQLSQDFAAYKKQADSNYSAAMRERNTWRTISYVSIAAGGAVTLTWLIVDVIIPLIKGHK